MFAIHSLSPDFVQPHYATEGSSGMDICSIVELELEAGEIKAIPCGFALEMPPGYEAQIRPRSGLALNHGVTVLNAPGTIDSDYRGEVKVILINHGARALHITKGMRIAQMVFAAVQRAELQERELLSSTERGSGGFGSTGL